jgi:rubrerythrin
MRDQLQAVLRQIAESPELEARWLHTVSLMEFIGARKISRTVADRHPSLDVLNHLADETRHACAFKRLSAEVAGGEISEFLCAEAAGRYFQALDHELATWATSLTGTADVYLHYLLTTTTIERRAMVLYPLYKAATRRPNVREELGRVVVEEQSHRRAIEDACVAQLQGAGGALETALAVEERLFAAFLGEIEKAIAPPLKHD